MTGYLYILKHGIGPGTMPNDVTILKEKDLPNYYTAVWLDRFLTTSELKQYDIPFETRINELLSRIDYCQTNNGDDVVPCDEVLASSYIKSAREPKWWGSTYSCQVIDAYNKGELTYKNIEEWETEYNGGFKPSNMGTKGILDYYIKTGKDPRDDVEACGDIKASKKIVASKMSDIGLLMKEALECTTKDELSSVISGLDSLGLRKLYLHYMEMLRDDSLSVGYVASDLSDTLYNMFSGEVNACDKVTAAIQLPIDPEDTIYDLYQIATEWCDDSEVDQIFINNGTSPDSRFIVDENTDVMQAYIDLIDYIRNHVRPDSLNEREYALVYDDEVEACDTVDASDTKYFANMVNCSSDPELDDNFLIEGYYDSQRQGLAESAETSDVSALNDLANEYANKGYYIVVHNLTDGVITEFSADNWFNDIAPDGGAELFMSW